MLFTLSNCVFSLICLMIVSRLECLPDINKFKKTVSILNYFSVFISIYQVFTSTTCIRSPKLMYWAQWCAREKEMTSSVTEVLSVTMHIPIQYLHSTAKYYECMEVHAFIVLVIVLFVEVVQQVHLGLSSGSHMNNASATVFQTVLKVSHVFCKELKINKACSSYFIFVVFSG